MMWSMFERALYYPTIDIQNEAWLKSAALFWDRIETIVPESEERPYRRRSTRLLQDEGILFAHRVNPYSEEVIGLEEDVVKYINTSEGKRSFVKPWRRPAMSVANNMRGKGLLEDRPQMLREYYERKWADKYRDFYIHVEKMPMILRERFGLQETDDGYVLASRGFMSFYMTLLSNRICQNNRMALLTDRVYQNNLSNKILTDGLTPAVGKRNMRNVKRAMMYQVIIDDIKVDPHTPIEAIVRYKRERRHELASFRAEMDRLLAFDTDGMNEKDLEHEVQRIYMERVLPTIDALKATLKDARINWMTGLGTCVMTGVMPAIIGFGPDIKTNVAIGVCEGLGLALSSLPYLLKRNDYESSPYSYLVKINRELSAYRRV